MFPISKEIVNKLSESLRSFIKYRASLYFKDRVNFVFNKENSNALFCKIGLISLEKKTVIISFVASPLIKYKYCLLH